MRIILAYASAIAYVSCQHTTKNEEDKVSDSVSCESTEIQMYQYPSGATGSLPFDWETGERGEPVQEILKQ